MAFPAEFLQNIRFFSDAYVTVYSLTKISLGMKKFLARLLKHVGTWRGIFETSVRYVFHQVKTGLDKNFSGPDVAS